MTKKTTSSPAGSTLWAVRRGDVDRYRAAAERGPEVAGEARRTGDGPLRLDEDDAWGGLSWSRHGDILKVSMSGMMVKGARYYYCPTDLATRLFQQASEDGSIKGVFVVVDSPGGTAAGTQELAEAIRSCAAEKPTHFYGADLVASAAIWAASQGSRFTVNPSCFVGSIGTYAVLADETKFWEELGFSLTLVTTGELKGLGADGKVDDDFIAEVQREVDLHVAIFKSEVAGGRRLSSEAVDRLATGRVWIADEAVSLGLADAVSPRAAAFAALQLEVATMSEPNKQNPPAAPQMTADQVRSFLNSNPDVLALAVADSGGKYVAAPQPATARELREAFPNDAAFALAQVEAGATLAAAKAAYADELQRRMADSKGGGEQPQSQSQQRQGQAPLPEPARGGASSNGQPQPIFNAATFKP